VLPQVAPSASAAARGGGRERPTGTRVEKEGVVLGVMVEGVE